MKEESRAVFKTVQKWYEVVSIVYLFVGPPLGGPLVHLLRHHGRGRDGEDGRHLCERVGRVRRGGVAIHYY